MEVALFGSVMACRQVYPVPGTLTHRTRLSGCAANDPCMHGLAMLS